LGNEAGRFEEHNFPKWYSVAKRPASFPGSSLFDIVFPNELTLSLRRISEMRDPPPQEGFRKPFLLLMLLIYPDETILDLRRISEMRDLLQKTGMYQFSLSQ